MRYLLIIVVVMISCCLEKVTAQTSDTILINQLVKEISEMQYKSDGEYSFRKGMFYSYKKWAGHPERITPDNNIYYTTITAFALRNMQPYLSEHNKQVCSTIITNAATAYPFYQNKRKLPSYFFWETGKPIMPNTYFIYHLTKAIANPEDIDDSVMILMTSDTPESTIQLLKRMMDSVANGELHQVKTTYKKYRDIPAHSTYLGHKWGVDFDFSIHCNVLYFLLDKNISFNKFDSATVTLVSTMVANRDYMKDPKYISPYYITSPVLLYHLTRLMGQFKIPELERYKPQLVQDIKQLLLHTNNIMEDIILSTSLLRLGYVADPLPIDLNIFNKSNQEQFVFYQAPTGSQVLNPFKRILLNFGMINYYFYCPAYNKTLLLEYLVERNRVASSAVNR